MGEAKGGLNGKKWCAPTDQMREDNAAHIMSLKRKFMLGEWGVADGEVDVVWVIPQTHASRYLKMMLISMLALEWLKIRM